jgi:hypothetical protein
MGRAGIEPATHGFSGPERIACFPEEIEEFLSGGGVCAEQALNGWADLRFLMSSWAALTPGQRGSVLAFVRACVERPSSHSCEHRSRAVGGSPRSSAFGKRSGHTSAPEGQGGSLRGKGPTDSPAAVRSDVGTLSLPQQQSQHKEQSCKG